MPEDTALLNKRNQRETRMRLESFGLRLESIGRDKVLILQVQTVGTADLNIAMSREARTSRD